MRSINYRLDANGGIEALTSPPLAAHELDHEVTELVIELPEVLKGLELKTCEPSIHVQLPSGLAVQDRPTVREEALTWPIKRAVSAGGRYVFSLKFVAPSGQVATTGDSLFIVGPRVDAGDSELEELAPGVIEGIQADLAWLKANGGGVGSEVSKAYVDEADATVLAEAKAYADTLTTSVEVNGTTYTSVAGTITLPNLATEAQGAKADTALQEETDPTVPAWAKAETKPTYTAAEVGAEATGAVATHNSSGTAHSDIRTALDTKATVWSGTQAAYDAITPKVATTLYLIVG